jgi:hypothetical protein
VTAPVQTAAIIPIAQAPCNRQVVNGGVGTSDHQKDRGMIKSAKKPSLVCIAGKVVGCQAAEHREKANGIDEACGEGRPVSNTCGDAH